VRHLPLPVMLVNAVQGVQENPNAEAERQES
jgi:hypothetical protein